MRDTDYRAAPSWAVAAAFVLFGFHAPGGEANEWPSFRGERAWGVADGTNPPVEWDVEVTMATPALALGLIVYRTLKKPRRHRHLSVAQR